jgi:glycosyltransferase involved in cell wall biosynthesis
MKLFRKKIVFHLHGKGISQQLNNPMKKLLYKFVFKNQDIITLSELLDYDIKDVFKGRIFHVPNGISKVDYNDNEKPINKVPKILYLSNLIKSKGILDFLDSLEILAHKNIDFNAFIVGKEADLTKQDLNLLIEKKNISKSVMYLGPKYNKEKTEIYLQSEVLVFPTKYPNETFGLVNIEAMQFGLPVVSTNEGAISEIIDDGVTGFIVDKNSPEQIADKIEFLINNPEKRIEMGKAGREKFLNNYTIDIFEKNMTNVFSSILGG